MLLKEKLGQNFEHTRNNRNIRFTRAVQLLSAGTTRQEGKSFLSIVRERPADREERGKRQIGTKSERERVREIEREEGDRATERKSEGGNTCV